MGPQQRQVREAPLCIAFIDSSFLCYSLRIRIPDTLSVKTPPITYGREFSGVRPQSGPSTLNILQSMADSGLKYVHASGRGKQGTAGDLEKTRKQLLDLGYVYKENFDEDEIDDYHDHKRSNPALLERQELEKKAKEDSTKAYEEWIINKDMRDQALRCLQLLPSIKAKDEAGNSLISDRSHHSMQSLRSLQQQNLPATNSSKFRRADYEHVIRIGEALKKVDRTLFHDWSKWCDAIIKPNIALILWDSFAPIACDVHSLAYSQIRDTFMKLLRPGFDIKTTFTDFAKKQRPGSQSRDLYQADDKKSLDLAVSKDQMQVLLRQMGIMMKESEMRLLVDAFDANNDGSITLQEFLDFVGPKRDKKSGSSQVLNRRCCWLTTCKRTGMTNAYVVSALPKSGRGREFKDDSGAKEVLDGHAGKIEIKAMPNGEQRMCVELKERTMREEVLQHFNLLAPANNDRSAETKSQSKRGYDRKDDDDDGYGDDFDDGDAKQPASSEGDDSRCDASKWTSQDRSGGLQYLLDISQDARQEEALKNILTQGKPPLPPQCWCTPSSRPDELNLHWGPQKGDLVSFYSLEYAGVAKGQAQGSEVYYREILRDPPDAHPDSRFQFNHRMDNLLPSTSYLFRIRGFNGYGPGDFLYKVFTTVPAAPAVPRPITISSDAVTLRWVFSSGFDRHIAELKRIFHDADRDGSGTVSRDELLHIFEDKLSSSVDLKKFILRAARQRGVDLSSGYGALFDLIEGDDDGYLSYNEFQDFFLQGGYLDTSNASAAAASTASSTAAAAAASNVTYVIEKCTSEFDESYSLVMKTTSGRAMITHLQPGQSYRFRLYAINVDGTPGPYSDTIVIHTMLETPCPPALATNGLGTNSVTLTWKPRNQMQSTRNQRIVGRMLEDWAGTHQDEDGGVSIEAAFARYDRDGSGDIDASELAVMLQDLGVEPSEERIRLAIDLLDVNGDGKVSFEEFGKWWRRDEVSYTIKRSEAIVASSTTAASNPLLTSTSMTASNQRSSRAFGLSAIPEEPSNIDLRSTGSRPKSAPRPRSMTSASQQNLRPSPTATPAIADVAVPIVSYRGTDSKVSISGLEANRLYHFKLRYVGSRSNSLLSRFFRVMTKPLQPSAPILIDVTATVLRVKWYPAANGAYKFQVQLFHNSGKAAGESNTWNTVFMGQETFFTSTTLSPETNYRLRVLAINAQGQLSDPSPELAFSTPHRSLQEINRETFSIKNIDSAFSIECTNDICVGDTILITERLYAKKKASGAASSAAAAPGDLMRESISKMRSSGANLRSSSSAMSVASLLSEGKPESLGTFLGERTIAAHVVKDNYRTVRDLIPSSTTLSPDDLSMQVSKHRRLWLEVVWQRSKSAACKPYELKPGEVIERQQMKLEAYEVFRCPWKAEDQRQPLLMEWKGLEECYISID
jgi:Ca2+-binding EF-hand superfamily protein